MAIVLFSLLCLRASRRDREPGKLAFESVWSCHGTAWDLRNGLSLHSTTCARGRFVVGSRIDPGEERTGKYLMVAPQANIISCSNAVGVRLK